MAKKLTLKRRDTTEEVVKDLKTPPEPTKEKIDIKSVVSTGSTLLDLTISGKRIRGGGMPGGVIVEIFGPSSAGKTAILAELAGNVQAQGGEAEFYDPEARLDKEYSRIYGLDISEQNYKRPDTVNEMFDRILKWKPQNNDIINISCADSLAALSTEMEMKDEDKMGMKRAKDFSSNLRKTARMIAKNNWLIACTNQERHGGTPGGKAIPYYSSLRLKVKQSYPVSKITKTKKIHGTEATKTIGVRSDVIAVKSSIDEPWRECNISIIFGYGIDDIRENLIYCKQYMGKTKYPCPGGEEWATINKAITHIEEYNLEAALREQTIDLWYEIDELFQLERKRKR